MYVFHEYFSLGKPFSEFTLKNFSPLQEDRIGSVDTGPKSWATGTSTTQNEESGWISWLFPIALALGASAFYRFYFVK